MPRRKYTPELLADAAAASFSIAGVLRYLGVPQAGGTHAHISRLLKRFEVDTSHFTGQGWLKGRKVPAKLPPEHWLKVHPPGSGRVNGQRLRKALIALGVRYRCSLCGNEGEWQELPLTLHVDHVNGDYLDCRRENLRFLCPNCHAQTPTHAGRNKGRAAA